MFRVYTQRRRRQSTHEVVCSLVPVEGEFDGMKESHPTKGDDDGEENSSNGLFGPLTTPGCPRDAGDSIPRYLVVTILGGVHRRDTRRIPWNPEKG